MPATVLGSDVIAVGKRKKKQEKKSFPIELTFHEEVEKNKKTR